MVSTCTARYITFYKRCIYSAGSHSGAADFDGAGARLAGASRLEYFTIDDERPRRSCPDRADVRSAAAHSSLSIQHRQPLDHEFCYSKCSIVNQQAPPLETLGLLCLAVVGCGNGDDVVL